MKEVLDRLNKRKTKVGEFETNPQPMPARYMGSPNGASQMLGRLMDSIQSPSGRRFLNQTPLSEPVEI